MSTCIHTRAHVSVTKFTETSPLSPPSESIDLDLHQQLRSPVIVFYPACLIFFVAWGEMGPSSDHKALVCERPESGERESLLLGCNVRAQVQIHKHTLFKYPSIGFLRRGMFAAPTELGATSSMESSRPAPSATFTAAGTVALLLKTRARAAPALVAAVLPLQLLLSCWPVQLLPRRASVASSTLCTDCVVIVSVTFC